MITPQDIDKKEFSKGRGYKDDEVDDFLEEVAASLNELIAENNKLKDTIAEWQAKYEGALTKYANLETSLYSTLESAKTLMSDIAKSAEKRASLLISNAQIDADNILAKAQSDARNLLIDSEIRLKEIKAEEAFLRENVERSKSSLASVLSALTGMASPSGDEAFVPGENEAKEQ